MTENRRQWLHDISAPTPKRVPMEYHEPAAMQLRDDEQAIYVRIERVHPHWHGIEPIALGRGQRLTLTVDAKGSISVALSHAPETP